MKKLKYLVCLILVLITSVILIGCNNAVTRLPSSICISVVRDEGTSFKYYQAQNEVLKEVKCIAVSLYETVTEEELVEVARAICLTYGITDSIVVQKSDSEILINIGEINTVASFESAEILLN